MGFIDAFIHCWHYFCQVRSGNTDKLNIISFQQNQQHKINLSTQLIFDRILTKTVVQLTLNTEFDKFQQFVKAVVKAKPQLDFAKEYVQQRCQIKDVFSRLYQDASLIKTKMTQIRDIYQQNLCTEQKKKSNNIDPSKTMRITFEDQLLGNVKSVCVQFFEKIGEKFPIQVQPALVLNSGFDDDDVPEYQKKRGMLKSAFASKIGEVVRPKTSLNISKVIVGSDLDKI
ncbi:Conserved_hypothetical protein [Hexamita inflata]|uniref:Uncharacterized protein n=1 Tax=Hexamita inflata TaxID=28002 RepID=A0AA86UF41_9EUKA|nr:Conserved hypothetical protein [Hexamita inflata]